MPQSEDNLPYLTLAEYAAGVGASVRTIRRRMASGDLASDAKLPGQTGGHLFRRDRPELVAYLAGEGMSTRAIAPIVGAGKDTVHRDLATVSPETVDRPSIDIDAEAVS